MLKRFFVTIIALLVLGYAGATPAPTYAQVTWCYTFDLTGSNGGWTVSTRFSNNHGTYITSTGWQHTDAVNPSTSPTAYYRLVFIKYDFGETASLTQVRTTYNYTRGSFFNFAAQGYGLYSASGNIQSFSAGSLSDGTITQTWNGGVDTTTLEVYLRASQALSASYSGSALITEVYLEGTGDSPFEENECEGEPPAPSGWTRPFLLEDEYSGGLALYDFDYIYGEALLTYSGLPDLDTIVAAPARYRVHALSEEGNIPVLAATGGEVVDIVHASVDMCSIWGVLINNSCLVTYPQSSSLFVLYEFPVDFDVELVTIALDDGTELRYMVKNANQYVQIGTVVQAGCVIGESIPTYETQVSQFANFISTIVGIINGIDSLVERGDGASFGITLIEHRDPTEILPILPLMDTLTAYSTTTEPCNLNPNYRDCLVANPEMRRNAESWTLFGDAQAFNVGGVRLGPGSYVQQVRNVPEEATFTFRVGIYLDLFDLIGQENQSATHIVTFRVGNFSETQTIDTSQSYQEFAIEVTDPGPDPSGLGYTIRVANTGTGVFWVNGACLSTDDRELNPRACYFQNADFDGITGWIQSPDTQVGNGYVRVIDDGVIAQEATLSPNPDASPRTYRLEVDARILPASGVTYNPSAGSVTLTMFWDEVAETIGTLDLAWNQPGNPGYPDAPQTIGVDFEVDETATDNFIIAVTVEDNATVGAVAIDRACLTANPTTPTPGGVSGPFKTTCSTISIPGDDSFGSWIMYHWRNLDKFFNCHLMVLLNKWFRMFDDFRYTAVWYMRYSVALVRHIGDWANIMIWWLQGHFNNMAMGQVTTINQAGGGPGIWDVLLALITNILGPLVGMVGQIVSLLVSLVAQAANLLFAVLTGAVVIILQVISQILAFARLAQELLAALITAYNTATPQEIPGFPNCYYDPQSSGICVLFWVLDNTIFSGTGAAIIPVAVAIGSIHLLLWVVGEVKHTILQVGQTS